jgi:hypothetical protein
MWIDVCRNYFIERLSVAINLIENAWNIISLEINKCIEKLHLSITELPGFLNKYLLGKTLIVLFAPFAPCAYLYLSDFPYIHNLEEFCFVIYSFSKPSFYLFKLFKYSLSTYVLFYYRSFDHPICAISLDSWSSIFSVDLWKLSPNVFENEFVPYFVLSSAFYFSSNTKYFMCLHL